MAWRIGVDIGGTFTDVALVERAIRKSPGDRFGSMREVLGVLESARENGARGPGRA